MQSSDGTGKMGYNAGDLAVDLIDLGPWGCSADGDCPAVLGRGRDGCWLVLSAGYMYSVDIARSLFSSKSRSTIPSPPSLHDMHMAAVLSFIAFIHSFN